MRILLVEDEPDIAETTGEYLKKQGFIVDVADSLRFAREAIRSCQYEVVILDRMLPDGDGVELIRFCQQQGLVNRFLVLSAMSQLNDKLAGLSLGADDYITKPFEPQELLARIRVAMRHPLKVVDNNVKVGRLRYDSGSHNIFLDDELFLLSRRELAILVLLMKRANRVIAREAIEQAVYSFDDDITSNTLESHMSRLRKKLLQADAGVSIQTVRGVGYLLKAL
ncbi:response regulator transcription factor [Shewanella sp. C32]|uniref:Response regulator transcription factor n=1 Tax=Shewanella electrica TaxID=515560 RepID=A0ABT2FF52_9GAMM|nr:response regulator transcription factor [Shewanella electrica]MCH1925069.1 response regulator transcription factor [Shewanella electrica]MCS4554893.1 response regulator transcription factor [Shewanella electrica]